MLMLLLAAALTQSSPAPSNAWVDGARALLGRRYEWGGRLRRGEGIDCLGVVLAAAQNATGCGWRSFRVNPTELVARRELGIPVEGVAPVATAALDVTRLEAGDVVMLLGATENPAEPPLAHLGQVPVWVWHMGVYSGAGRWLVGDHFAGEVVEVELLAYLKEHQDTYQGVYVVRPVGTKPAVCRVATPSSAPRLPTRR